MNLSIHNPQHKAQILKENFSSSDEEQTIQEYVLISADEDPDFFFWLLEPYNEEQEDEVLNLSPSQSSSFTSEILRYL